MGSFWTPAPELQQSVPAPVLDAPVERFSEKSRQFLAHFEEELRKTSIKYLKKVWSKEEDEALLELRKDGSKWTEIAEKIPNCNPQICKRRFLRIKQDEEKWPLEVEEQIRSVCGLSNMKWEQKIKTIHDKFPQVRSYSKKMIKERYLTYLEEHIEQKPWTIEEDLTLIRLLQKGVKKWKNVAKAIPGRTELHLKNRYYGCLRAIERKVEGLLRSNKSSTESQ